MRIAPLTRLQHALDGLSFALAGERRAELEVLRDRVRAEVDTHIARIRDLDAPLLVVFGGVTGAGKSTVVNSLLGVRVVATGVVRPTTYGPTLVSHPDDRGWFTGDRILPDLPRVEHDGHGGGGAASGGGAGDAGVLRLVAHDALPAGLALVDAPDVDSISDANRDLADALLDAADVWVWFTSAGKYADEESMRYLRRAASRRTAVAVALTQVHAEDEREITDDFRRKLAEAGLPDVPLTVVPFVPPSDGLLPDGVVAGLRAWLADLAAPAVRRARRRQTLEGALEALPLEVAPLLGGVDDAARAARLLLDDATDAYRRAEQQFAAALEQGLPLRQEVLGRWNRFVGGGRFLRLAEEASGQARSWIRNLIATPLDAEEARLERQVRLEVGETLRGVIVQLGDLAAAETADAWQRTTGGRDLLAADPRLERSDAVLARRAEEEIAAWQEHVAGLVQTKGAERRTRARWLSTVVNAGATGAIVLALAHTGGFTGAEAGIATAAGAANQALLVKLLGAQNLRWLVARAKADLVERFSAIADHERRRFSSAVAAAAPDDEQRDAVTDALAAVAKALP